ncbi:MAG: tRNA lysidine(34) synthetase, partial [bacterium]
GGEPYERERVNSILAFSERYGIDIRIVKADIYNKAFSNLNPFSPCFTCSRLRRKALFEEASRVGANKVALAHHFDDTIETLFINIMFGREISTMMPKQSLFDGRYHIIRPLVFISESYLKRYARLLSFPVTPYNCPFALKSKRGFVKRLLSALERKFPGIKRNIYYALYNVKLDYLLAKYSPKHSGS